MFKWRFEKRMRSLSVKQLNEVGQVVWYDNLSREVLEDGTLTILIASGVTGLTSNPTIFQKAILNSNGYDTATKALMKKAKELDLSGQALVEYVCEELCVEDVGMAADLLKEAYRDSQGIDGYASLEVSPDLAYDTEGTIKAAERLWKKLGRSNVMIKVPATREGVAAVESLIYKGINVNVTLIFSVDRYREVANAYIRAIELRVKDGLSVSSIASVASFFVSRVDSIIAKKRGGEEEEFLGKVSIANCRLAYEVFQELFDNPSFKATSAHPQKPLWASTGVKSERLSPTFYVEKLAAPNTVNTMPPSTLKSVVAGCPVGDLLQVTVEEAKGRVKALEARGLSFDALVDDLMVEGVTLFADSYKELLRGIEAKVELLSSASF
jgi:transaldolase